jgi:putative membrane protein
MFGGNRLVELVVRWLLLAASVWVAAELLDGIELEGWESTLAVAGILGVLNLYLRPILMVLALPFTLLTLGLFIIVVNAILLGVTDWIADQVEDIHFEVETVGAALLGALIISLVNMLLERIIRPSQFA